MPAAKRLGEAADRHRMFVGHHCHLAGTPAVYEQAMSFGKYAGANVDLGHFVAGNNMSVALLLGASASDASQLNRADALGVDPIGALRRSADDLESTFAEEGMLDNMPVLADALEEAGCANAAILDHCRGREQHRRGCWVLDLLRPLDGWRINHFLQFGGSDCQHPPAARPLCNSLGGGR